MALPLDHNSALAKLYRFRRVCLSIVNEKAGFTDKDWDIVYPEFSDISDADWPAMKKRIDAQKKKKNPDHCKLAWMAGFIQHKGRSWSVEKQQHLVTALSQAEPSSNSIFEWEPSRFEDRFDPSKYKLSAMCKEPMKVLRWYLANDEDYSVFDFTGRDLTSEFAIAKAALEAKGKRRESVALGSGKGGGTKMRRGTIGPGKKSTDSGHEGMSNYILVDGLSGGLEHQNEYGMMNSGYETGYNGQETAILDHSLQLDSSYHYHPFIRDEFEYNDAFGSGSSLLIGGVVGASSVVIVMLIFCIGLAFGMVIYWGYSQKRALDVKRKKVEMRNWINDDEDR
eukprot:221078_1